MTESRWSDYRIDDTGKLVGGATPSTRRPEYWDGDIHWTTTKPLGSSYFLDSGEKFISEAGLANSSTTLIPKGNLLVGTRVGVGKISVNTVDVAISQDLTGILVDTTRFDPVFLAFCLSQPEIRGVMLRQARGVTIKGLPREDLRAISFRAPPKPEQQQIATVLVTAQRAIKVEDKLIAAARNLKRTAMRQLFTFGIRGERQKDSELGPIPESWDIVRLGDVCHLSTGTTPATKRTDYYQGHVPFIKTFEIVNNRITEASTFLSAEAVADYSLRLYPAGTVLMAMYGQGKTRGQVALLEIAAATTQNAAAIQPNGGLDADFLWQYLRSSYDRLRGMGSLGHLSHLNLGYLRDLTLVQPPISEQREIADVLHIQDRMVSAHTRKREVLTELFTHLLDGLMSSRIRIAHHRMST